MDIDAQIKRASLISDKIYGLTKKKSKRRLSELVAPPDKFYLAAIFSLLSGMVGVIPMTFFATANDYWMYKLRDTAYETYDLNNKTFLQKMYMSMNSMGNAVPSVLSVLLSVKFAHKIEQRKRFLLTLGFMSAMFIIFTSLVEVHTDSWQITFFVLALLILGLIALVFPCYSMTNITFLSKFPSYYMKLNMFGTATGGLFGSLLQIICLSIGNNPIDVAIIYFSSGTVLVCLTFLLAYLIKFSPVVDFYMKNADEQEKPKYNIKEYYEAAKTVWPLLVMFLITSLTQGMSHPNITNLVFSEGYIQGGSNLWYNKYFVVVATFFNYDIFQLLGRAIAKPVLNKNNHWWFIALVALRSFALCPLFLFCNTNPKEHLPLWFPHDYQYIILQICSSLSLSIIMTMQVLSVPNFAGEKTELAYTVLSGFMLCALTALSPLNSAYVLLL